MTMIRLRKNTLFSLVAILCASSGCSSVSSFLSGTPQEEKVDNLVVNYHADSLRNYKAGRDFAAAGRYELAREHYLLALAAANDPILREALTQELDSVALMIKSLR